ncbi:MAG: hypothetical protein WBO29_01705 [Albidovulum sp.]
MIKKKRQLLLAARTRQSIIDLIAGVRDATDMGWDDVSPNWLTQDRIKNLAADLKSSLLRLGAIEIELHAPCGGPKHADRASSIRTSANYSSNNYWCFCLKDKPRAPIEPVKDGTGVFRHDGRLYNSKASGSSTMVKSGCPCRPGVRQSSHLRYSYVAWPVDSTSRLGELAAVQRNIGYAASLATERGRRSAIREQLLDSLIDLERLIVPETAQEHVDRILKGAAIRQQ